LDTVQKAHVPLQAGAGNAEATICVSSVSVFVSYYVSKFEGTE